MYNTFIPFNVLNYKGFNSFSFAASICNRCQTSLSNWFLYGKLPENPVVTPSTSVQVITPSNINRYLQSVTVEATSTTGA